MEDKINKGILLTNELDESFLSPITDRRIFGKTLAKTFLTIGIALCTDAADAAVLQSEPCTSGEGSSCDDLAGGNEFIKTLQKKSAENRAKNEKVGRD